jgi:hypothetical protein
VFQDPHNFLWKLSMTVEINQKELYYNCYTSSGKFLTLKFKLQVKSSDLPPTSDTSLCPWRSVQSPYNTEPYSCEGIWKSKSTAIVLRSYRQVLTFLSSILITAVSIVACSYFYSYVVLFKFIPASFTKFQSYDLP